MTKEEVKDLLVIMRNVYNENNVYKLSFDYSEKLIKRETV